MSTIVFDITDSAVLPSLFMRKGRKTRLPNLKAEDRRSVQVQLRLTPAEYKDMSTKAIEAQRPLSAYLREKALS